MGSSKVNVRQALAVFQKILDHGERIDDDYVLSGLRANQGFDGYTASIFNDYVRLDIQFHQRFTFEYSNEKEKRAFLEKLAQLALPKPQ